MMSSMYERMVGIVDTTPSGRFVWTICTNLVCFSIFWTPPWMPLNNGKSSLSSLLFASIPLTPFQTPWRRNSSSFNIIDNMWHVYVFGVPIIKCVSIFVYADIGLVSKLTVFWNHTLEFRIVITTVSWCPGQDPQMGWAGVLCSSLELMLAAARTGNTACTLYHWLYCRSLSTIASIIVIPGPVATLSTFLWVCTAQWENPG